MPYRRIYFEKNQPIHIVSRALAEIFKQSEDCYKFIFYFQSANLGKRGFNIHAKDIIKIGQALLRGERVSSKFIIQEHPPLVHLLDYALTMNHYHFYLLPNDENVIPILMQKLNNAFAQSFNLTHKRKDAVFGRRYTGIIIKNELQSFAVSRYVSVINPLDVFQPGWRENGLKDPKKAFDFLEKYEFSSFPDKIGKRKSQILAPRGILEQYAPFWGNTDEYKNFIKEFLKERSASPYSDIFLE